MADAAVADAAVAAANPAASGWKPWLRAKAQTTFNYLFTKDYEVANVGKSKTARKIRNNQRVRLRGYVVICMLGFGTMHWGGAEKVLNHMNQIEGDKEEKLLANKYVRFLTFAFNCSIVGITAGTFPTTAPWPFFFAGLGAWQSVLFLLALFHLETREYHLEQQHAIYSFHMSGFLFSLYWSHACQDPLPLHTIGKVVVSVVWYLCYLLRWIWESKAAAVCWFWKMLCRSPNPRNLLPRFRINRRRDS